MSKRKSIRVISLTTLLTVSISLFGDLLPSNNANNSILSSSNNNSNSFSITAYADDPYDGEYVKNEDGDYPVYKTPENESLEDMFMFGTDEVTDVLEWLKDRQDMIILEKNMDTQQLWLNVPNLQNLIFGKVDGVFACGFTEPGVDITVETEDSLYSARKWRVKTAMQELSFDIPSLTYKGEYPVVQYSLSSVLPSGVWGTIKSAIRGLFGGSFIDPPESAEDFGTLKYSNLNDYVEDYAMCNWIAKYWDNTCASLEDGQVLLPKKITGNSEGEVDGVNYTYETCIIDNDLETVEGTVQEFNRKLKTTFGQYYGPIMNCMVALGPDAETQPTLTNYTLRQMPYDVNTIYETGDFNVSLVPDPRCDSDALLNIVHQVDPQNTKHMIYPKVISMFAQISKFTWFLDQLTDFTFLEQRGVKFDWLWQPSIARIIGSLFIIFFLVKCGQYAFRYFRGILGGKEVICKLVTGILGLAIFVGLVYNPNRFYNDFKDFAKIPETMAVNLFEDETTESFYKDDATDDDRYELNYWIPYFEMWSYYNTNHSLSSDDQIMDNFRYDENSLAGMFDDDYSDYYGRFDIMLAQSFTKGYMVNLNAYRVVDHFLAPKINYSWGDYDITSSRAKSYNGDIQTRMSANWMIILDLFVMELIKVFLFFNMCLEFAFLFIFILFRYKEEGFMPTLKSFVASFVMYMIATCAVPMVSNFTYMADSELLPSFLLTVVFFLFLAGIKVFLKRAPEWLSPKLLLAIKYKGLKKGRR